MDYLKGTVLKERYRVDEFLGRGGMADVYKVWDEQRGVFLAMKVLRADLAEDRVFLRRFEREAQNLTRLQHPNIVRCYGLEREGRTAFMLMDFIEGETLRTEIFDANGPLSTDRIIEILQPICSALGYAHEMGMVHCDVKSGNIMIHKNGTVYLTDFGIARGMDAATSTMVGIGTPAYMAPELIKGMDPTPQTDIYALGIVLYEMVTGGERPFTGERATITGTTAEKVRWEHLNLEPQYKLDFDLDISKKINEIISKCLAKEPQTRFSSAHDLFHTLSIIKGEGDVSQSVDEKIVPASENEIISSGSENDQSSDPLPLNYHKILGLWISFCLITFGSGWILNELGYLFFFLPYFLFVIGGSIFIKCYLFSKKTKIVFSILSTAFIILGLAIFFIALFPEFMYIEIKNVEGITEYSIPGLRIAGTVISLIPISIGCGQGMHAYITRNNNFLKKGRIILGAGLIILGISFTLK